MCKTFGKKSVKLLLAGMCLALVCMSQAISKPKTELIKEEDGYYYGYGKASSSEEALAIAKKDLIETALTTTLRAKDKKASRVTVSDEVAAERLPGIKPIYPKAKDLTNVAFKVSIKDWEKDEKTFDEKLRKSLTPKYNTITVKGSAAEKINTASEILNELAAAGQTNLLTLQAGGTELFSRKVEGVCESLIGNLVFEITTKNGITGPDTEFVVNVKDKTGAAVSGLKLKAVWSIPALAITSNAEEVAEVVSTAVTDSEGNAKVDYPVGEEYTNKIMCLTVSTAISMTEHSTKEMRKLDAASSVEGHYVYYENLSSAYQFVAVQAGEYTTGAVESDRRAGTKEKARTVTLAAYGIDLAPVTNFQYAAYLYLTDSEKSPEYFDNSDYNQDNQPVVGISAADAEAYALWLSEQTGEKYRLPTDDEWEVAARAGTTNIYPWGDDAPNKTKSANFKGNGQFKTPSPVGSFMNGANAWGLVDMSGNVWEWTSNCREGAEGTRTVKGGSWMDGPQDLRISNFKNIDSEIGGPDVGFRLVKEISNEEE